MIKLFDPIIDSNEKVAIAKVLSSHFWASGSGTGNVMKFENKFQKYVGLVKGDFAYDQVVATEFSEYWS